MIRVLNVVVDNNIGGIQNRVLMVGELLKDNNIETIILSPRGEGDFSKIANNKGFIVHQASIESPKFFTTFSNIKKNIYWFIAFPFSVWRIISIIRTERIDIVHSNGLLSLQAAVAAKITNKPLVWHLISTIYPSRLVWLLRFIFINWPNRIIFVANKTKNYYLGDMYYESLNKVITIYEPVDTEKLSPSFHISIEKSDNFKSILGLTSKSATIGFIGNINPQKGLEYFIYSANIIKKEYAGQIKFLIVGDVKSRHTSYYNSLMSLIVDYGLERDIFFVGRVDDIRDALSVMDIFLITSIAEGTPLVILEAMAMGKPVVATDVGGISEQVINSHTGLLVPPRDIEAISKAVIYLLEHPKEIIRMGENGRRRAENIFSLDACALKHTELYHSIVGDYYEKKKF